jgi:hypothetical protein
MSPFSHPDAELSLLFRESNRYTASASRDYWISCPPPVDYLAGTVTAFGHGLDVPRAYPPDGHPVRHIHKGVKNASPCAQEVCLRVRVAASHCRMALRVRRQRFGQERLADLRPLALILQDTDRRHQHGLQSALRLRVCLVITVLGQLAPTDRQLQLDDANGSTDSCKY